MKRWLGAVALALLAVGCSSEKPAVKTAQVYDQTTGVREGMLVTMGDNKMVLIDPQGSEAGIVLNYNDQTAFVKRGEIVKSNDVKEGTPVRVFFKEGTDQPQALRVEVLEGDEAKSVEKGHQEEIPSSK